MQHRQHAQPGSRLISEQAHRHVLVGRIQVGGRLIEEDEALQGLLPVRRGLGGQDLGERPREADSLALTA